MRHIANLKAGVVTHYYDKIGVAVVDLTNSLHTGDTVKFSGSTDFSQTVTTIQVEHEKIESAKKGDTVGLKVDQPVKPGDEVLKAS